ncbi:hypothetical protein GGI04_005187, partial [Coemansia thaxteri]
MTSRGDSESLCGSSIYQDGRSAEDADLPEYAQLCRRLFPALLDASDDDTTAEPETEENLARYLKYLTGLPLASVKMEPALLHSDLQRISNELNAVLLKETADRSSEATETSNSDNVFSVLHETNKLSEAASSNFGADLEKAQEALSHLESACSLFATTALDLDRRAKVVQQVLDKQDLITRIVELPRVMQMCVAGGYYEEAVEIAEHVRITGDRLVRDISDGVRTLSGFREEPHAPTGATWDQLVGFVTTIQKQVHAEFEAMILAICRELCYVRSTAAVPAQRGGHGSKSGTGSRRNSDPSLSSKTSLLVDVGGGGSNSRNSYEKSMKRLSQVSKVVAILRSVCIFPESELRMLYLRSRWQAWMYMAESLNGHASSFMDVVDSAEVGTGLPTASFPLCSTFSPPSSFRRQVSERGPSSSEVAAYLSNYIELFFSWLAEVNMQYRTLFSAGPLTNEPNDQNEQPWPVGDPFEDLALYSSRRFQANVLPLLDLLTEASAITNLQALVATHSRTLSRSGIDFVAPVLAQSLRERAFVSVVRGVEEATALTCTNLLALANHPTATSTSGDQKWDQLAVPTRPSLGLPDNLSILSLADPVEVLDRHRVSPVGLLQYPLWAQLLHSYRESLHSLRILILADDGTDPALGGANEVLTLLNMTSVVLESELIQCAQALADLCGRTLSDVGADQLATTPSSKRAKQAVKDACAAFVFGIVRNVAEIFEEVTTLCEGAAAAGPDSADSSAPIITLYSEA